MGLWDSVIVGEGNRGFTAVNLNNYKNISHNSSSFWIHPVFCDFYGMTVFKNTEEGKKLQALIDMNEGEPSIFNWLKLVFIQYAEPGKILDIISHMSTQRYEDGRRDKLKEVKDVLELY